jgi:thiol-disulfide isomerase/thioredoxin
MRYSLKDVLLDLLLVGALLLVALGLYKGFIKMRAALNDPTAGGKLMAVGEKIPGNWTVETLNGEKVQISQLKGKVVFLNIWATWCGPCLLELPSIEKLYNLYKDSDIAFLCVTEEDAGKVRKFLQKDPDSISVPIYLAKGIPAALKVMSLPTTYILDREGRVALSRAGAADWSRKKIIEHIHELLQAPRAESDK